LSDIVAQSSRETIRQGSTSFAAAASLFDSRTRDDASMLYAWCRYCDDQIDGQVLGHGAIGLDKGVAEARLAALRVKTQAALAGEDMSDDHVFGAFQRVVLRHEIPERHPLDLLHGFGMDVGDYRYETLEDVLLYAYHVAGVVGVMMAMIMGVRDVETLRRAADLGLGLQLTNIARDVMNDAAGGRIYLPGAWLKEEGIHDGNIADPSQREAVFAVTRRLLEAAEPYYESARWGLRKLPARSAWAIAAARGLYREIGRNVARSGAGGMDRRASVGKASRVFQVLLGGLVAGRSATLDRFTCPVRRPDLWSKF
jgi:phytoene synthase